MITFRQEGDFRSITGYLENLKGTFHSGILDKYGKIGVAALSSATPVRTGKTAASWKYHIERGPDSVALVFTNSNLAQDWAPIAILVDRGHATARGGWIEGRHYIEPAIRPVFDQLAKDVGKEVRGK